MDISLLSLPISSIKRDIQAQPRVKINAVAVMEYAEDMKSGAIFPPVTVFNDGATYWLADGYHRVEAALSIGATEIPSNVKLGSKRDAILHAVGANSTHGLRRSNGDKRRAIEMLLVDPEWCQWSDREIARRCGVHHQLVAKVRSSLDDHPVRARKYSTKHGTTATMNATKNKIDNQLLGNRVTISTIHPSVGGKSGTICRMSNPGEVIVELDSGERELINIEDLRSAVAPHLQLNPGSLVEVRNPNNPAIHNRQGRIASIGTETVEVWVRDIERMTMHRHRLPIKQVEPLPIESEPKLLEITERLQRLIAIGLDPFELDLISMLERAVVLTPTEMDYLTLIEKRHCAVEKS